MSSRTVTLQGKAFAAVNPIEKFLTDKVKGFKRDDVNDGVEIAAMIIPIATNVKFEKGSGSWEIFTFEDKANKSRTQKALVLGISEGKIFEVNIPGQGVWILSYNGKDVKFESDTDFDNETFEEISKINIAESNLRRANERIRLEKERMAKEEVELKARQSASVKPFTVDFDDETIVAPMVTTPVPRVSISPKSKKDLGEKRDHDRDGETYRPFANLSPQARTDKALREDFEAGFEKLESTDLKAPKKVLFEIGFKI